MYIYNVHVHGMYVCTYVGMCVCLCVCVCACLCVCMHAWMDVWTDGWIMYVYVYPEKIPTVTLIGSRTICRNDT